MSRTKAAPNSAKTLSRRILVNVKRDPMTHTPRVIWQHEFPLLEAIFGDEVKIVDPATLDEGFTKKLSPDLMPFTKAHDPLSPPSHNLGLGYVFTGDPAAEYARLEQVYGMHREIKQSMVEHVYGRFQEGRFEAVVSGAEVEDLPESQLRDLARDHGYIPITGRDSTLEERKAAEAAQKKLRDMSHADLLKVADELGIAVG